MERDRWRVARRLDSDCTLVFQLDAAAPDPEGLQVSVINRPVTVRLVRDWHRGWQAHAILPAAQVPAMNALDIVLALPEPTRLRTPLVIWMPVGAG